MRLFRRFLKEGRTPFGACPTPSQPFYAVGDIHGRDDLLGRMIDVIRQDAQGKAVRIVCVGDVIDRGDASAAVLHRLLAITQDPKSDLVCLRGNHEDMMRHFLRDPERHGARWLRHGGLQTLASFGIAGVSESTAGAGLRVARDQLATAMGGTLLGWLEALPLQWSSGNVTVVHAGADPARPIEAQDGDTLVWGHPDFRRVCRHDGQWIVAGHTVVETPEVRDGRISIDTGAYATGRLTAVHVAAQGLRFLQA